MKKVILLTLLILGSILSKAQCGCDISNCSTSSVFNGTAYFQIYYGSTVTLNAPPLPPNNWGTTSYAWFSSSDYSPINPNSLNPPLQPFINGNFAMSYTIDPMDYMPLPYNTFQYFVCRTGSSLCSGCPQCFYGRSFKVVFFNVPPPVISNSNISICQGDSVMLSATNTAGICKWYANSCSGSLVGTGNSIWVHPTSTTTYFVNAQNGTSGLSLTYSTCSSVTVSVNPLPTIGNTVIPSSTVCAGSSITLNGTGGTSYNWSGGVNDNVAFIPSSTTTYTVTGTDVNGCTNTATQSITVNTLPTVGITTSPSATLCIGNSLTLNGTGATSYSWSGSVNNNVAFIPNSTTTYTVTGTGANGCTSTTTQLITVNPLPTVGNTVTPSSTVCAGNPITLNGTGATSYSWSGSVTDNVSFIPSSTTTYTVTGTDINGCTNTASQSITVNTLPAVGIIASPSTTLCTGNSLTLNGTGATSYSWSGSVNNNISFIPSSTTSYTVTGTGANGCTNTTTQLVTVNPLPTVGNTVTPLSTVCAGNPITLNGTGATSYSWSGSVNNNVAFIPSSTATYTVTGTDINGCTNTATQLITVNALPTVSITPSGVTTFCQGNSVTLISSSSFNNVWSNNATTQFLNVTSTGNYFVSLTDINGCVGTSNAIAVTVNPIPTATITPNGTTTFCQGSSVILISGSTSGNVWSNSLTSQFITVTTSGNYSVTVTDVNNCTATSTITPVTVNPLPIITTSLNGTTISSNQNGGTYQWLDCNNGNSQIAGATNQSFTPNSNGNYAVSVTLNSCTDVSACVQIISVGINETANNNQVVISPNPFTEQTTITFNEGQKNTTIKIIDVLGKEIKVINFTGKEFTLEKGEMKSGIYFVQITDERKNIDNRKIIVQ